MSNTQKIFIRGLSGFITIFIVIIAVMFGIGEWRDRKAYQTANANHKVIEVEGSVVNGYDNGRLSWTVKVNYIWRSQNPFLFEAEGITTGRLYDNKGRVILDDLKANAIRVNSKSRIVNAYGNVSGCFIERENRTPSENRKKRIKVTAQTLRFFDAAKSVYLSGSVVLEKEDVRISPNGEIVLDGNQNMLYVNNGFIMESNEFLVSANFMQVDIDNNLTQIRNAVSGIRKAEKRPEAGLDNREAKLRQSPAYFTCDHLTYNTASNNLVVEASGPIEIRHQDKRLTGTHALFDREEGLFSMDSGVTLESGDVMWLLDEKKKARFGNEELDAALRSPMRLTCNRMRFDSDTRCLELYEDIIIRQGLRKLECQKISLEDKKNMLTLFGKVKIETESQERLQSQYIHLDLQNETFDAGSGVQVDFDVSE